MTLLIQQRLVLDVIAYQHAVELIVLAPLCPLSISLADFGHAADLIARARRATTDWLESAGGHRPHADRFLAMHGHHDATHADRGAAA